MKKGFTMIELIFVIVILGILAAVAIPRLSATRDDANIAKALSEVSTLESDLGAYYTSQGRFDGNVSAALTQANIDAMTNVKAVPSATAGSIKYQTDDGGATVDCVNFALTADGNVTVTSLGGTGNVCQGLVGSNGFADINGTKTYGGRRVNF